MASITISTDIAGGEENFFMLPWCNLYSTCDLLLVVAGCNCKPLCVRFLRLSSQQPFYTTNTTATKDHMEFPSNALSNNMDYAKDELALEQYKCTVHWSWWSPLSKSSQCTHLLRVHRSYCVSVERPYPIFRSSLPAPKFWLLAHRLASDRCRRPLNHQSPNSSPLHENI